MSIGSVVSTRHFHTQRYSFVKHPMCFFNKRQNLFENIKKLFCSITSHDVWSEEVMPPPPGDKFLEFNSLRQRLHDISAVAAGRRINYIRSTQVPHRHCFDW